MIVETLSLTALGLTEKAESETVEEPAAEVEAARRSSIEIGKKLCELQLDDKILLECSVFLQCLITV